MSCDQKPCATLTAVAEKYGWYAMLAHVRAATSPEKPTW